VTFLGSSLPRHLERIVVDLTAARACISKGTRLLRYADTAAAPRDSDVSVTEYQGLVDRGREFINWGERKANDIIAGLRLSTPPRTNRQYSTAK